MSFMQQDAQPPPGGGFSGYQHDPPPRHTSSPSLPPGAMAASVPGQSPTSPSYTGAYPQQQSLNGYFPTQQTPPPGSMRPSASMGEFGVRNTHSPVPSSSSHRTLPQPATGGQGSLPSSSKGRRPLPTPPKPPQVPTAYEQNSVPRTLPSIPRPSDPSNPPQIPQISLSTDIPPTPPPKPQSNYGSLRDNASRYGHQLGEPSIESSYSHHSSGRSSGHHSSTLETSIMPSMDGSKSGDTYYDDEGGTNVTLKPTSPLPSGHSDDGSDRRKTPTPSQQILDELQPPPTLLPEGRPRTSSSSTIGAFDAGLPATPRAAPVRILEDQNGAFKPTLNLVPPSERVQSRPSSSQNDSPTRLAYDEDDGTASSRSQAQGSSPLQRQKSRTASLDPSVTSTRPSVLSSLSPSWAEQQQQPSSWVTRKLQIHQSHESEDAYDDESGLGSVYDEDGEEYPEDEDEGYVNEYRFFQPAFLSEAALQLRDKVERRRQTKAGIAWVGSFTGKDIVTTIQSFLPPYVKETPNDRRFALLTAQSLKNQLWFVEVDWVDKPLHDSPEDVFRFMGEMEGISAGDGLNSELPSGLMTMATRCYSPSCPQDDRCYASRCPYRQSPKTFLQDIRQDTALPASSSSGSGSGHREVRSDWTETVDPRVLNDLSEDQREKQRLIRQAIQAEVQFEADLTALEDLYIAGLRQADPPIIPHHKLESFISEVFSNEAEVHEVSKRLLDHFTIRERESAQDSLILSVGDIYLQAAADFRDVYPEYTGNLPHAENTLRQETEENPDFRFFCDRIARENDGRRHIKYLITRPSDQLQHYYPAVLEAILNTTPPDDPDRDFLGAALSSIQNLSAISQLRLFHASKGRGQAGKKQWPDVVPEDLRETIPKKEQKRQMQIWELIQGEMDYVADLETMDTLFVEKLRIAEHGPIIERSRLEVFLDEAFHNYRSLLEVHTQLLENLQARQIEQHPQVGAIGDLLLDAALNWQDAYMEYVTHYPIAKAKVQEEELKNPKFAAFLKECLKDPIAHRQDIYHFINRPVPRLLRYPLLLGDILKSLGEAGCPDDHPDIEAIPQVMDLIKDLARATQKGVAVNESKVELWTYVHSLDGSKFGPRVVKDLDLLNPMRELIHRKKVFRQPEGPMSSWAELTVLLFDNYLVLVKPEKHRSSRREERQERYVINRRPIPLELLNLGNFADAPRSRRERSRLAIGGGGSHEPEAGTSDAADPSNKVWPFNISFIGQGQLGGQYTLWSESYAARAEWQEKLQHAKVLRMEVNDANKVFEMTPLSQDTFYMSPSYGPPSSDSAYTGRVTCSVPFTTVDGRTLVAIGCEEGVWIGLRHDPHSLRKVLHVKAVTNIAVLEEFGIFLVLQDKSLLAYHLEALVPSASSPQVRAAPQRLSPGKDISFFSVGRSNGRTLVLYMKRKGIDSLFRVLEPVAVRDAEMANRQRRPFGNLLGQRSEHFRLYKDFFIPTEALSVHWLKAKLAIVCPKGFEIMDLVDLKGGSIPIFDPAKVREKPQLAELQRRCETARPLGMFRSTETEFLLCYDSFGMYVDRHGEPNRDRMAIDWEGRPDSVAFHPPFVLLVSAPFIEIRHIDSGKLLQIYTGTDIRVTWDGTGGMARPPQDNPGPKGYGDETSSQEPRIHICQRAEDARRHRGPAQGIGQTIYELTPTLALNNPLLNPIHTHDSNYFPPAPMMYNHRASSVMTSNSGEFYAGSVMTPRMSMSSFTGTQSGTPPGQTPPQMYSAAQQQTPGQDARDPRSGQSNHGHAAYPSTSHQSGNPTIRGSARYSPEQAQRVLTEQNGYGAPRTSTGYGDPAGSYAFRGNNQYGSPPDSGGRRISDQSSNNNHDTQRNGYNNEYNRYSPGNPNGNGRVDGRDGRIYLDAGQNGQNGTGNGNGDHHTRLPQAGNMSMPSAHPYQPEYQIPRSNTNSSYDSTYSSYGYGREPRR